MRIIAGFARGTKLIPPPSSVRPSTDRVKESLFAILGDLSGKTVVDLFAGSGALGLEALSRGAGQVVWVECNRRHCRIIQRNLDKIGKAIPSPYTAEIVQCRARGVPLHLSGLAADIILSDPPYQPREEEDTAQALLEDGAFMQWVRAATLVIEQSRHVPFTPGKGWTQLQRRRYGDTLLYFLKRDEKMA